MIINYASYMKKKDDVALSGLTASATNELFEVGFGGMITLTAAVVFENLVELKDAFCQLMKEKEGTEIYQLPALDNALAVLEGRRPPTPVVEGRSSLPE